VNIEGVRELVAGHSPEFSAGAVVRLGEGSDNVAYEVDGRLIVRFAKEPDPAEIEREARLLVAVADASPLTVPEPRFLVPELGCLAYLKVPGIPLLERPPTARMQAAATLGGFLSALHGIPVERMAGLVEIDEVPAAEWLDEAAENFAIVADQVPSAHHSAIEAFLAARLPDERFVPVFSHNDLGIEHVLVEPESYAVTGVIDWSDAAIVDPANDFGRIHRDLGPAALDVALGNYRTDLDDVQAVRERAVFFARCSVFEDLAFGLETGRTLYTDKCLTSLDWLFPASR
jgi:aminoglycoside phosphotransferase (APT) family kinase protein